MIASTSDHRRATCTIGGAEYEITGFAFEGCRLALQDGPTVTWPGTSHVLRVAADAHIARNLDALIALAKV
jgi:hypothetical protein